MGLITTNNPKIELNTVITDSRLSDQQKETWYQFIDVIIESDALSILSTIKEDTNVLDFLTENLEEKLKAMKTGNKNDWNNIVKKEKDYIESK